MIFSLGGIYLSDIIASGGSYEWTKVLFEDGKIVHYDVSHLLEKGIFTLLKDVDFYRKRCTVMNNTLAWMCLESTILKIV